MKILLALAASCLAASAIAQSAGFTDMGLCDYSRPGYRTANYNKKAQWADSLTIQVKEDLDMNTYRVWNAYGNTEQYMEFTTHVNDQGRTVVTVPQQECTGMSYTGSGLAVPVQLSTVDVWVQAMKEAGDSTYTEQELQDFINDYPSYYDEQEGKFIMNNVYWLPAGQRYAFMYFAMDKEYVELQGWRFQDCSIEVARPLFSDEPTPNLGVDVSLRNCGECRLFAKAYPANGLTNETINEIRNAMLNDGDGIIITESCHTQLPLSKLTDGRKYVLYALWTNKDGQYRTNHNGYVTSFACYTFQNTAPEQGWTNIGWGTYTDGIVCDMVDLSTIYPDGYTTDVEMQESETTPGVYKLLNPYASLAAVMDTTTTSYASASMTVDATDPTKVFIARGETGLTVTEYDEDGYPEKVQLGFTSQPYEASLDGSEATLFGTLEDGVVTFPCPDTTLEFGPWPLSGLKNDVPVPVNRHGNFRILLPEGTQTGVCEAKTGINPAEGVYNLQGVRLDSPIDRLPAGMYIINGKKVAICH